MIESALHCECLQSSYKYGRARVMGGKTGNTTPSSIVTVSHTITHYYWPEDLTYQGLADSQFPTYIVLSYIQRMQRRAARGQSCQRHERKLLALKGTNSDSGPTDRPQQRKSSGHIQKIFVEPSCLLPVPDS